MSFFTRFARTHRLAAALVVVSTLAGSTGCATATDATNAADSADVTDIGSTSSTSSALSSAEPGSFLLDLAESLIEGALDKAIFGDGIDYERINKMFEEDLEKFAGKEHVRDAGTHVSGALSTLHLVVGSYDPNAPVDNNQVALLEQRADRLNDDLASMRSEDVKKIGLRTYLWAATVQHAVLQTLATIDKAHAAEHTKRLRIAMTEHVSYVDGRVVEFQNDATKRLAAVTGCTYQGGWFGNNWCWFDDKSADYGNDVAIPNVEGHFYGDQSKAYTWDRARAWDVPEGTVWHNAEATVEHSAWDNCVTARGQYYADMQDKLNHQNGFVADANLPDTRALLAAWKDALAKLGGPLA